MWCNWHLKADLQKTWFLLKSLIFLKVLVIHKQGFHFRSLSEFLLAGISEFIIAKVTKDFLNKFFFTSLCSISFYQYPLQTSQLPEFSNLMNFQVQLLSLDEGIQYMKESGKPHAIIDKKPVYALIFPHLSGFMHPHWSQNVTETFMLTQCTSILRHLCWHNAHFKNLIFLSSV